MTRNGLPSGLPSGLSAGLSKGSSERPEGMPFLGGAAGPGDLKAASKISPRFFYLSLVLPAFWFFPGAGLNISGLGGLDKAYQDHLKGSLEDVRKLSRPPTWS